MRRIIPFAALLLLMILKPCAPALAADTALSNRVLILHSYHPGFLWTDEEMNGILAEMYTRDPHFEPFSEYLDWKRFPTQKHLDDLAIIYKEKYAAKHFGVVIVTDNTALEFAIKYRKEIFNNAPIIFCGINGYEPSMIAGQPNITGVVENIDPLGTLQNALRLLPETRRVLVLIEDTESGNGQTLDVQKAEAALKGRLEFHYLHDPTLDEAIEEAKRAPANSILLLGSFASDRTGRAFPDFGVDMLSAGCPIPMFSLWDFLVGKGVVGGSMLSGRIQGRTAGRLALRVLDGEKDIPVILAPPTELKFDYAQLVRWRIPLSRLSADSQVINEPITFFKRNRQMVLAGLVVMALMALVIALLSLSVVARRRVEKELEKTKALLQAAIEQSPAGIMIAEAPDVIVTVANPAAERIMGVPMAQQTQVSYLQPGGIAWQGFKTNGEPYQPVELALPQAVLNGTISDNLEMRIVRPDGHERWILINGAPIRDKAGDITAGIIVFADITQRKNMERLVIQSEKMLSIGGLAAGMAHEINNPLGIIVQTAQNALRRLSPELPANILAAAQAGVDLDAVNRYLNDRHIPLYIADIVDAGLRAARIVRSMLNFSRRSDSIRSPQPINTLLDKAVELVLADFDISRNYDIKNIRFIRRYDPANPAGMFVETEIIQVFLNLIKNAAQAMAAKVFGQDREPAITLTTRRVGKSLVIDVEDNGPGMDAATSTRIMEPFFTTKVVGEGTGLGLSVTYFIVTNSYGGTLDVWSEPGQGTRFTVSLPCGESENAS